MYAIAARLEDVAFMVQISIQGHNNNGEWADENPDK